MHRLRPAQGDEDGFTLIELLVVIVILGVLATIAIPTFLGQRGAAIDASAKADVRNLARIRAVYDTDSNPNPSIADLTADGFASSPGVSHGLCQTRVEFAAGAIHVESDSVFVVDPGGQLREYVGLTLKEALDDAMGVDCDTISYEVD